MSTWTRLATTRSRMAGPLDLGEARRRAPQRCGFLLRTRSPAQIEEPAPGCSGRRRTPGAREARRRPRSGGTSGSPARADSRSPCGARLFALVGHAALGHRHLHVPVALEVVHRALRRVDGQLVEVRPTESRQLRIEVREEPALEGQDLFEKSMPGTMLAGQKATAARSRRRKLSGMRSSTMRPTFFNGTTSSGMKLGRVEHVEVERVGLDHSVKSCRHWSPTPGSCRRRSRPTCRAGGSRGRRR